MQVVLARKGFMDAQTITVTEQTEVVVPDGKQGEKPTETPKPVSRSEFDHVLNDLHKWKTQARDAEDKLKARETDELKAKEEWQKVAQLHEEENKKLKTNLTQIQENFINDKKFSALKECALKENILDSAVNDLELVDLSKLAVETTSTGKVNILGAKQAVEELKTIRSHWFGRKGGANINLNSPTVLNGVQKITMKDINKAEKEAHKTGNFDVYQSLVLKYKQQLKLGD